MAEVIDLRKGKMSAHVTQAAEWIASGFVVIVPLEHGYAYVVDSFSHDAVRAMHVLRGDDLGVAAQVLIAGDDVLAGIARDLPVSARTLMNEFWPGALSFYLFPQRGLSWDLGDNKDLDLLCVRVPNTKFMLALLRRTGPLAMASAAKAGEPPILNKDLLSIRGSDVEGVFHTGKLKPGPASTVISAIGSDIRVLREGAISLVQLREVVPDLLDKNGESAPISELKGNE